MPEIGVMIKQKARNKKRPVLMLISVQSIKNHGTRITYTSQFVLMPCPKRFVLMFCGTSSLALFLACSYFFCQNQGFYSYKIVLV